MNIVEYTDETLCLNMVIMKHSSIKRTLKLHSLARKSQEMPDSQLHAWFAAFRGVNKEEAVGKTHNPCLCFGGLCACRFAGA